MATIQISFRDNSTSETNFKIYRGTSSTLTTSDTLIATISLNSSTWEITGNNGSGHALTSTNTGSSGTTGETFTINYTETNPGTYYYGILANNAVGNSNLVTGANSVVVAS